MRSQKFLVTIAAEVFGKVTRFGVEEIEIIYNVQGGEGLEWKNPIVPSRAVNKNEAIWTLHMVMVSPKAISTWTLSR